MKRGPEWKGWENLNEPRDLEWRIIRDEISSYWECFIGEHTLAILEKRPHYCDRGKWSVKAMIPGIDGTDSFPRYYMEHKTAVRETELWLKWRLWRKFRDPDRDMKAK